MPSPTNRDLACRSSCQMTAILQAELQIENNEKNVFSHKLGSFVSGGANNCLWRSLRLVVLDGTTVPPDSFGNSEMPL